MTTCYPDTITWGDGKPDDAALVELAETFAWTTLDQLTLGRISICPVTVRPARATCSPASYFISPLGGGLGPFHPYIGEGGRWYNARHAPGCSCHDERVIELPGPVGGIESVEIDGDILDPRAYRVDDARFLVREDGHGWPLAQNLWEPEGGDDTFTVTYYQGAAPNAQINFAAGMLAREFVKLQTGSKTCRLPRGTTTVVRNGVSVEISQPVFADGLTGIMEVDAIVGQYNPNRLRFTPRVYSPDVPRARQVTARTMRLPDGLVADPARPGFYTKGA